MNTSQTPNRLSVVNRYSAAVIIAWTLIAAGSLAWNLLDQHRMALAVAKNDALVTFNKDQAFRHWATKHGGVYVPATEETPPNPYLKYIPDRDIRLPSGTMLTLMNPAYAMRQIMHDYEKEYGIKGHITSLKPLNPFNAPDEWERTALQAFERGTTEVSDITAMNGQQYLRLIRPMIVKKGCLKCHARQGYHEGDIRGGVSVSLPLSPFLAGEHGVRRDTLITHGLIWLIGLGGIGFIANRSKKNIREHLRNEETIRTSEERLRNLIDTSSDFVWEIDEQGVYTYLSPRVRDILGYEPEELLGKKPFELMPPEEARRVTEVFGAVVASKKPFQLLENVNVHKGGRPVVLESSGAPFFDNEGRLQGYRGIDRDISERKRVEEEHRRLKEFFEGIAENIVTGVWVSDKDDVIFYANKGIAAIAGIPTHQLVGAHVVRDFPARTIHNFIPLYIKAKETLQPLFYESLHGITPANRESYLSGWLVPRTKNGRYDGMICTVEDVTERKKAEEALLGSNRMFKAMIQVAPLAIILLDTDKNVRMWNPAAERIFGWSEEEVLGRPNPLVPMDRMDEYHHLTEEVMRGVIVVNRETQRTRKNGSRVDVSLSTALMWGPDGKVSGRLSIIADITERKRSAEEKEKLEQLLRQAQKMEAIGQLAGGVAHDFNNILTAIIGYGNILKMKMAPADPLRSSLDPILTSAERAAGLTHSLLSFSRKQVVNPKPVDLCGIIRNVQALLSRLIGEDVSLTVAVPDRSLIVMADAGQLEQVLMNLATNARDAMSEGGLLTIEARAHDLDEKFMHAHGYGEPGRYAVIALSDTGCGMDEATRERIFEPFFTTKASGKGTGLGLSIVYSIIKQHRGAISVYSEPGKGTTFRIYLPLIASTVHEGEAAPAPMPRGGSETILVAEDDAVVRELIDSILKDFGYTVVTASDGQDAIEKFQNNPALADLLILDVIMPKKSGREVSKAVKAIRPGAKIIFTSGYTADILQTKGMFDEGIDLVPKPINPLDLLRKIREVLDSR